MMAATIKLATALLACAGAANAASLHHRGRQADTAAVEDTTITTSDSQYLATLVLDLYTTVTGGDTAATTTTTTTTGDVVDNCAALVWDANYGRGFSAYAAASTADAEAAAMESCTTTEPPEGGDLARDCQAITSFCSDDCIAIALRYDWGGKVAIGTGVTDDAGVEVPMPPTVAMAAPIAQCTKDACADPQWAPLCAKGIPVCYVDYLVCGLGSVEYAEYSTGKLRYNMAEDVDLARFPVGDSGITTIMDLAAAPEGGFPLKLDGSTTTAAATEDTAVAPAEDGVELADVVDTVVDAAGTVADVVDSALSGDLAGAVDSVVSALS